MKFYNGGLYKSKERNRGTSPIIDRGMGDVNAGGGINVIDLQQAQGNLNATASCLSLPNDNTMPPERQLTWDAENRLTAVEPVHPVEGDKKLEFAYDYMGRRVQKLIFSWDETLNSGAGDWKTTPDEDLRFVYDQWNVVLVLDGNDDNGVIRKYTWGLDLSGLSGTPGSGGIHGAGGIGGLLAVEETTTEGSPSYWYLYDGNGNVGQVINADDQSIVAHYEYDPYGNTIVIDDADNSGIAYANPFRFSTKWFDNETGLGYWGYRYYSRRLGRWLSRDPITEYGARRLATFSFEQAVLADYSGCSPFDRDSNICQCAASARVKRANVYDASVSTKYVYGLTSLWSDPHWDHSGMNIYEYAANAPSTFTDHLGLIACGSWKCGYCEPPYPSNKECCTESDVGKKKWTHCMYWKGWVCATREVCIAVWICENRKPKPRWGLLRVEGQ